MIKCRNEDRITPSVALQHSFLDFAAATRSRLSDMMLLPTTTLLLENIYPQNGENDVEAKITLLKERRHVPVIS